jgi:hypothetical protein
MPGVIYLPPPQSTSKSSRSRNAPPPQASFEMAPWAIYPTSSGARATPSPPPAHIQHSQQSAITTQKSPSTGRNSSALRITRSTQRTSPPKRNRSIQRTRSSSVASTKRLSRRSSPLSKSSPQIQPSQLQQSSPPPETIPEEMVQHIRQVEPVQPIEAAAQQVQVSQSNISTIHQQLKPTTVETPVQIQQQQPHQPDPDPLQSFHFSDEEWAALMTPPPLTWGLPCASDSPPVEDFELPEHELQLHPSVSQPPLQHFHQMQQQQQTECSSSAAHNACFGSPILNEFLQQLLPHDAPLEDRQGWYDFLNAPIGCEDKGLESGHDLMMGSSNPNMPQYFHGPTEGLDDDRLWWGMSMFGGGGEV